MKFAKNIVKGLLVIACLMMPSYFVYAGTTEVLNVDFEGITYDEFKELDAVTIRQGISTDNLTIGEESPGNQAFRIYRTEAEVIENTTSLGFNYKLPVTLTTGKVNVSFKIKAENVYRSRWRDLGSAMTSGGKRNLFLFTYSRWAWAQSTGSGYWNSVIETPDVWYEVKYEIDLDTQNVVVGAGKIGTTIQTKEKTCSGGDFASLEFTIGKQHNSWTASGTEGDIIYWIDDIKVMVSGVNVLSTSVDGREDNAPVDEALKVTFDEIIDDGNLNSDIFILKSGEETVLANISKESDKVIKIEPVDGFQYNKEYALTVKTGELSQSGGLDFEKIFKTPSVIDCNIENGKRYNEGFLPVLNEINGITYKAEFSVDDGEYVEYDFLTPFTTVGIYKLKITAEDENGKKQVNEYNFEVITSVAPIIEGDVIIEGEPVIGKKLIAVYEFKDENDDEQDLEKTVHKWIRIEKDGTEKVIAENTKEYILAEDDQDAYIKFTVIPYSDKAPYEGLQYESERFTCPMNPVADKITISGDITEGSELTVSYEYTDENGDEEIKDGDGKTVIIWYSSKDKESDFEKIGEGEKYILTDKENDCWIKVGIIPKNYGSGRQDREFISESFAGAFSPAAENVKIPGTLKSGNVVGVSYQFSDYNNDSEGETVIEWYVDDELVSSDDSYKIISADKGKKIYVTVTPVSKTAPFKGETVKSEVLRITSTSNESYSSGGGKGGGGSSVTNPVIKPDNNKPSEDNKSENKEESKIVFDDVLGHWAEKEITQMAQMGIINGDGKGNFMPEKSITRAELAAIMARAFELKGNADIFSDVSDDSWFKDAVFAVCENGYMNGYNGLFRPFDKITRQEMAVVLLNISKTKNFEMKTELRVYSDSDEVSEWAKEAVDFTVLSGLMNGVSEDIFNPKGMVTRAQAAVILSRIIK